MHTDVINNILRKGEGLTIEFKKAFKELPRNLFETVCAFLNRQGGTILLGVSDEGNVPLNDRMKYIIDLIFTHKNSNVEDLSIHFLVSEKTIKETWLI